MHLELTAEEARVVDAILADIQLKYKEGKKTVTIPINAFKIKHVDVIMRKQYQHQAAIAQEALSVETPATAQNE